MIRKLRIPKVSVDNCAIVIPIYLSSLSREIKASLVPTSLFSRVEEVGG